MTTKERDKILEEIKRLFFQGEGHICMASITMFIKKLPVDDTPTIKEVKEYCEKNNYKGVSIDFNKKDVAFLQEDSGFLVDLDKITNIITLDK